MSYLISLEATCEADAPGREWIFRGRHLWSLGVSDPWLRQQLPDGSPNPIDRSIRKILFEIGIRTLVYRKVKRLTSKTASLDFYIRQYIETRHGRRINKVLNLRMTGDNTDILLATIIGPQGSPYQDGAFDLDVIIPKRYPFEPPRITFLTPVYHPNIDNSGRICMDLLKMPPQGGWKPTLNLKNLLEAIQLLLANPNVDDPLMAEIAQEYRLNKASPTELEARYLASIVTALVAKPRPYERAPKKPGRELVALYINSEAQGNSGQRSRGPRKPNDEDDPPPNSGLALRKPGASRCRLPPPPAESRQATPLATSRATIDGSPPREKYAQEAAVGEANGGAEAAAIDRHGSNENRISGETGRCNVRGSSPLPSVSTIRRVPSIAQEGTSRRDSVLF
ncbi:hypothetical protein KM043_012863 [Ampulex compressa]|nr:hypothetical protein KM043_012863 [Ampulex compressa]